MNYLEPAVLAVIGLLLCAPANVISLDLSPSKIEKVEIVDRTDPCDLADTPRGNAFGLRKRCERAGSSSGVAKGDFNGDGYGDLAIGVPGESFPNYRYAGGVNVIYGSSTGLKPAGGPGIPAAQFWAQNDAGVPGNTVNDEYFGQSLASGDFNGDDFSDLAIGVNDYSAQNDYAGGVNVIYGSPFGLATAAANRPIAQLWTQDTEDVNGAAESGDGFGRSLAWGDFNGDGYGDLAIGASGEDVGSVEDAGSVNVIYGSNFGLTAIGNQLWTEDSIGVPEHAEKFDRFGSSLAAGDFNNDGRTDLAIGVPEEHSTGLYSGQGQVTVIYGSTGEGLTASTSGIPASQLWSQDVQFIADSAEEFDYFGASLAAGDFDCNGTADLAIGVPGENLLDATSTMRHGAGAVNLIYGTTGGLSATRTLINGDLSVTTQFWTQDAAGMPDNVETNDRFGKALTAGDFNGDGCKDLAVGSPKESLEEFQVTSAGAVFVIFGSQFRLGSFVLTPQRYTAYTEGFPELASDRQPNDEFGSALSSWNFGLGTNADLAIGVPNQKIGSVLNAGAVKVLYGSGSGFSSAMTFHQNISGVPDQAEAGDSFGRTVY